MKSLVNYFGCGHYKVIANHDIGEFCVTKFSDIINKIIPLFKNFPIGGVKVLYFDD